MRDSTREEIDALEARLRREMKEYRDRFSDMRLALAHGEVRGLPACPVLLEPRERLH